jgi:hypothetical protein
MHSLLQALQTLNITLDVFLLSFSTFNLVYQNLYILQYIYIIEHEEDASQLFFQIAKCSCLL